MNIQNGCRVRIKGGSTYKGRYNGESGTVERYYNSSSQVPVRLDNRKNEASSYGLFWFKMSDVEVIPGKGESGLRVVAARHIGINSNNKVFIWNVPDNITNIQINDVITVDTSRGKKEVVACSVITYGDDADQLLKLHNCVYPTKNVVSIKSKFVNVEIHKPEKLLNKQEERKMRTIGILDLWIENKSEGICEDEAIKIKSIKENDSLYILLLEKTKDINNLFPINESPFQNWIDCQWEDISDFISDETKDLIKKIKNDYSIKRYKINKLYIEIKTMLSACDTYEQGMEVLKNYGIVSENGILIKD